MKQNETNLEKKEKFFSCNFCDFKCTTKNLFTKHIQLVNHKNNEILKQDETKKEKKEK